MISSADFCVGAVERGRTVLACQALSARCGRNGTLEPLTEFRAAPAPLFQPTHSKFPALARRGTLPRAYGDYDGVCEA